MKSNVNYKKLGTIINLKRGFDLPTKDRKHGKFPVVASSSINGYHNEFKVQGPGVVIGRSGFLGGAQYIDEDFWPLNTALFVEDFKGNDIKYIYYLLKIIDFTKINSGSSVPTLNRNHAHQLLVPFVELQEQKKISKILSSFDQKIETNNAIIANLEAQAQAIFKSWFVDFEPFQDGDFVESELGMIPEGWEVKKIEEVTESLLGGTPARKKEEFWCGDIPWINSGELNKIRIIEPTEYITKKGLENSSTKLLPKKTTVIAITGATLGQVSLLEIDTCANQSVIGILENENLPYEYIYPFFLNNIDMIILNQTGSSQQHINNNDIKNTKMILPINKVMDAYEQIVSPIYKLVENYMFQNKVLSQTRDTLLPKLMSGEIRVGQDDIEEIENLL
jgi:type I restriction enzyme S subunit